MKAHRLAVLLVSVSVSYGQGATETQIAGTAINTTNPDKPVAAPIQFVMSQNGCVLTVSPPLIGSGSCKVRSVDAKSGYIEIVSNGSPSIVWRGTKKGNFVSGTYTIEVGAQTGLFYLAILDKKDAVPPPRPDVGVPSVPPTRGGCVPAIESAVTGEVEGWDGETIFKLDNGQIWQQAEYDYTYFYEYHPDVTIYKTSAGCRMKVEGEEETVLVKRIK